MSGKALKVAMQMDPLDGIDINADSSFAIMLEAAARGYTQYHYLPKDLSFYDGHVTAHAHPIEVRGDEGNHYTFGDPVKIDLGDMDVVWLRQDPPFDMGYITTTHILEHLAPDTLVVNDPASVRDAPEKLFITHFPDLMPPTLISYNREDILAFRDEHKDIIIKPLYGNGGAGVFHITPEDENLTALLEMFDTFYVDPPIIQKYLAEVRQGDKRIILIDGQVTGALNRIPAKGESRANLHVGAVGLQAELTDRELEICAAIGPELKARNLLFVGIDVIGDYMTEINVTSPTGIQEIDRFNGTNTPAIIWDAIESKLK